MFQDMRVSFLDRQSSGFGDCLERTKECAAVQFAALLADEQEV
jgi:hypothetical protein